MHQQAQGAESFGALSRRAGAELPGVALPRTASVRLDEHLRLRDSLVLAQLQLLERMNLAAAVVDGEERVVELNRRCDRVFGSSISRRCGRFVLDDRASNDRLRQAIRAVFSCQGRSQPEAGRGFISRDPEPPIMFKAVPLWLPTSSSPVSYALLIFSCPNLKPAPDLGLLARAFGLTPAQARLASHLAAGASLETAAAQLAIKKETARNHLKQIFVKTGTCRQGELVALLSACWLTAQDEF